MQLPKAILRSHWGEPLLALIQERFQDGAWSVLCWNQYDTRDIHFLRIVGGVHVVNVGGTQAEKHLSFPAQGDDEVSGLQPIYIEGEVASEWFDERLPDGCFVYYVHGRRRYIPPRK